jgi:Flp pilus assembly protein TadD
MSIDPLAEAFARARRQHERGDLKGAEVRYRNILASDPQHAGALHLLGVLTHQRGRLGAALVLMLRVVCPEPAERSKLFLVVRIHN